MPRVSFYPSSPTTVIKIATELNATDSRTIVKMLRSIEHITSTVIKPFFKIIT